MKKTVHKLSTLSFLLLLGSLLSAQCPSGVTTSDGVLGGTEIMMGQTIRNSCSYSLTAVTIRLATSSTATLTMRIKTVGSPVCNGSTLTNGTATIAAGASGNRTFNFSSAVTLAANTNYFIEITGTDAQKILSDGAQPYSNGTLYWSSSGSSCVSDASDLRFTLTGTTLPLPIELVQFDANTEGSKNLLTWRTESEQNNSHFDIERSTDGSTFHSIGQVRGNNKPSTYQFVDNQPFATSYYRLRQIDFDGIEMFSKIISAELKGNGKGLKVYPTLVTNGILTVDTEGGQLHDYSVTNLLGQQVLVGKTTTQIDVSSLSKGTYTLKVGTEVAKFVKQ